MGFCTNFVCDCELHDFYRRMRCEFLQEQIYSQKLRSFIRDLEVKESEQEILLSAQKRSISSLEVEIRDLNQKLEETEEELLFEQGQVQKLVCTTLQLQSKNKQQKQKLEETEADLLFEQGQIQKLVCTTLELQRKDREQKLVQSVNDRPKICSL